MKIIDIHSHVYPDAIAQHAADAISAFYDNVYPARGDGSVATLLARGEAAGITRHVVSSAATTPFSA